MICKEQVYTTLAGLLEGFGKINCLPRNLNIAHIDDGKGIEATLLSTKLSGMIHVDLSTT